MAYTENKSIDGLIAITPTIDDLVVTMDQAEVGVAKSSTLASIYTLFKTTYDTLYAKYLGDADFYKYSITTSVASGNLTVTLLNYLGATPSATAPVKIQIGGVIRTITSGTNLSPSGDGSSQIKSGTNWFNLGSAELATKETDLFLYLIYDTTLGNIGTLVSRIPYGTTIADFSITGTNEKARVTSPNINPISTDPVVNIGRFNATLSAGGAYTWSIPATSVIINRPCYETRWLDGVGTVRTWTNAPTSMTISYKYKIEGEKLFVKGRASGTQNASNSGTTIDITGPFSTPWAYHDMVYGTALWTDNATFDEFSLGAFRGNVGNGIWFLFQTTTGRRPNELNYSYMVQI